MEKFWKLQKIKNSAGKETSEAELLLYGPISSSSWWGDEITPKQFADDLKALGSVTQINVRINSPGGDVFAANAILNLLKSHSANKTVYIDGIAASAATIVAMVGKSVMPKNAMMMIHNPWSIAMGDSSQMRAMADVLDKVRETIVATYREKTGKSETKIIELMDQETWMTAKQAVKLGFADEIQETVKVAASISREILNINGVEMDTSKYKPISKLRVKDELLVLDPPAEDEGLPSPKPSPEAGEGVTEDANTRGPGSSDDGRHTEIETAARQTADRGNDGEGKDDNNFFDAVKAERKRIWEIDQLGIVGHDQLIIKAKYEEGWTAQKLSHEILMAEKGKRSQYLIDARNDAAVLNNVASVDVSHKLDESQRQASKIAAGADQTRNPKAIALSVS